MTICEKEQKFIADFNELDDWFLQYEYLIESSCGMPELPESLRTEKNRVPGCQSGVWVEVSRNAGKILIRAHSDALIIRGIMGVLLSLLNGRTPEEIEHYQMRFIKETSLMQQTSTDRFQGISAVLAEIKERIKEEGEI